MKIYKTAKSVVRFSPKAEEFLNGLTSNTIDKPQNAFVDVHGKIIATFAQYKINSDEVLIVVETGTVAGLLKHLSRYLMLSKVSAEALDWKVYFDLDGDYLMKRNEASIPQRKGKLILTRGNLPENTSEEEFTRFRLHNHIPLHGVDYTDDFLLNVSMQDHVSFTKGCFLGQEPISKVYNRSKPTWRLVVKAEEACNDEERAKMTSRIFDPQSKRTIGFTFEKNT